MLNVLRARMRRLVQCARAEVASRQPITTTTSSTPAVMSESYESSESVRAEDFVPSVSALRAQSDLAADDNGVECESTENADAPIATPRMRQAPDARLALRLYAVAARARHRYRQAILAQPKGISPTHRAHTRQFALATSSNTTAGFRSSAPTVRSGREDLKWS